MARRKLQKVFALLLTFSMLMSLLSVTALADEPGDSGAETHEHKQIACRTCGGDHKIEEYEICPECKGEAEVPMIGCLECDGDGWIGDWMGPPCPLCNGAGCPEGTTVDTQWGPLPACIWGNQWIYTACENCDGTGQVPDPDAACKTCGGAGKIQVEKDCQDCVDGTVPCDGTFESTVTTAPTCSSTGVKTYTCATCKASYDEEIPSDPTAHQWGEPQAKAGFEPTCGKDGVGTRTCTLCKQVEDVVMPATGVHSYDEKHICTVCGAEEPLDEETAAAKALIEALPASADALTPADLPAIQEAQAAYDALENKQKERISAKLVERLEAAVEKLDDLVAQAANELVMAADPDDLYSMAMAWKAVCALTEEQKELLPQGENLETLETNMEGKSVSELTKNNITVVTVAPQGLNLNIGNLNIKKIAGSMNLDPIEDALAVGTTLKAAYQIDDLSYELGPVASRLTADEQIEVIFRGEDTAGLPEGTKAYGHDGTRGSELKELDMEFQGDSLVIRLNKENYPNLSSCLAIVLPEVPLEMLDYGELAIKSVAPLVPEPTSQDVKLTLGQVEQSTEGGNVFFDAELTVTIGPGAPDEININLEEILGEAFYAIDHIDYNRVQPGDTLRFHIRVENNSGRDYGYVSDSVQISTVDYFSGASGVQSLGTGFDGFRIADDGAIPSRLLNKPLKDLGLSTTTDDAVGAALRAKGYGADDEGLTNAQIAQTYLGHYYLDYFNKDRADGNKAMSFQKLTIDELAELTDGYSYPTTETCQDVAEALYYFYYGQVYTFFGEPLYDHMEDNSMLDGEFAVALAADEPYVLVFSVLDGENVNNAFQNTHFGFGMQFRMKVTTDYQLTVTKTVTGDRTTVPAGFAIAVSGSGRTWTLNAGNAAYTDYGTSGRYTWTLTGETDGITAGTYTITESG